jgi:hypothetical protein
VILRPDRARSSVSPIASRTWEGCGTPDWQADPVEHWTPAVVLPVPGLEGSGHGTVVRLGAAGGEQDLRRPAADAPG